MVKRKVVQQGTSTLVVSLPATWVRTNKIKKGDDLELRAKGKSIVVMPERPASSLALTKDVSKLPAFLVTRFLARSYQKGYDQITLTYDDPQMLSTIQDKTQELIGYEIVERSRNKCLIKSISSTIDIDFDNSLRRAFRISQQMVQTLVEAYAEENMVVLESLYLQDFELNRLAYYCLRQMNLQGQIDPEDAHQSHVLYYLIELLEDVGDGYKELATILSKSKKQHPDMLELLKMIEKQANLAYEYFYQPKLQACIDSYELFKEISQKLDILAKSLKGGDETVAILRVKEVSDMLYHFTTMRLDFLNE